VRSKTFQQSVLSLSARNLKDLMAMAAEEGIPTADVQNKEGLVNKLAKRTYSAKMHTNEL
jgi:hypothetical protein